jgi:hypothetical protein
MEEQKLKEFIDETMNDRSASYKWLKLDMLGEKTQTYIEQKLGSKLNHISIDKHGIIHALKKTTHQLEPNDLFYASSVINTSSDVTVSPYKHNSCPVLIFKHDIGGGELTILTEVHSRDGYLLIFNAWR